MGEDCVDNFSYYTQLHQLTGDSKLNECESCGVVFECHELEESKLCSECIKTETLPTAESIIEFWNSRISNEVDDESS